MHCRTGREQRKEGISVKYAILGAGGMGIQYGVLLQEFAHQQVDFVDTWTENRIS